MGDTVFFMEDNKVKKGIITAIQFPQVFFRNSININTIKKEIQRTSIKYHVNNSKRLNNSGNGVGSPEKFFFSSKEDLLKSL